MTRVQPVVALYPGSFDPITKGHEDVARRSLAIADRVLVAVAHTASPATNDLFSVGERLEMVQEVFQEDDRIEGCQFGGLLVDFAQEVGAQFVIRGLRAVSDFEYEFQLAAMNRQLDSEIETVFLTPAENYTFVSATLVKEIASLGGDVSKFVHPEVLSALQQKLNTADTA